MNVLSEWTSTVFGPPQQRNLPVIIGTTALTTLALYKLTLESSKSTTAEVIKSPASTLLKGLSKKEIGELPYPPDALPGGRSVESPYGTLKVYEWGPEKGRKVLLVHGISTPCIALGGIAHALVAKGCRVMTFDLWGRGYSDTPTSLPHDNRLYTSQILLALSSSPLAWTGTAGFSLIGYSLGGGIAAAFTSYFPQLVDRLVLLAPAGLIRPVHMSGSSKFLYSTGLVPEAVLEWMVRRRLRAPVGKAEKTMVREGEVGAEDAVVAEVQGGAEFAAQDAPLSKTHPQLTVVKAVQWQLTHHLGFVKAFMSSIRHGPIQNQHAFWKRLAESDKEVLVVAGRKDPIIWAEELAEDVRGLGGRFEIRFVEGAHDFPVVDAEGVVDLVWGFWEGA